MDKKIFSVMSIIFVSLTVTVVIANSRTIDTPLYTVRMEQVSSKMNFLPTEMNEFTYSTEKGYEVDYDGFRGCSGVKAPPKCTELETTCVHTYCEYTCVASTCESTCPLTCDTCEGYTCTYTCDPTCFTCPVTECTCSPIC